MKLQPSRNGGRGGRSYASVVLPRACVEVALGALGRIASCLIRLGVSASAVTFTSASLCGLAAIFLARGELPLAFAAMLLGSLGDALDGIVARRTGTASVGGAVLDASADRYGELFLFAGLAVWARGSTPALLLVLAATAGSFMISYGSAKAEGLGLPAPPSVMRRTERAVCLCSGVALGAALGAFVRFGVVAPGVERVPVFGALAIVGVAGNVSAVRRLCGLAAHVPAPLDEATPREAPSDPVPGAPAYASPDMAVDS